MSPLFPRSIVLDVAIPPADLERFHSHWSTMMNEECHHHPVWVSPFASALADPRQPANFRFQLATTWAVNMVAGSYCFPRYVAALAARAPSDAVRHGLLENAWDESGGTRHQSRSHFWLAVRLARLLGLSDDEIRRFTPLPAAQQYTHEHFHACSTADFLEALGMLCLIEEFTTPEFSLVLRCLLDTCSSEGGIPLHRFLLDGGAEYFTANIGDDERHRQEMPMLVAYHLVAEGGRLDAATLGTDLAPLLAGVRRSIVQRDAFFADIYAHVAAGRTYRDLVAM